MTEPVESAPVKMWAPRLWNYLAAGIDSFQHQVCVMAMDYAIQKSKLDDAVLLELAGRIRAAEKPSPSLLQDARGSLKRLDNDYLEVFDEYEGYRNVPGIELPYLIPFRRFLAAQAVLAASNQNERAGAIGSLYHALAIERNIEQHETTQEMTGPATNRGNTSNLENAILAVIGPES